MTRALAIGRPVDILPFSYVTAAPYEAVVIGSLTLGELLRFSEPRTLEALAKGMQVLLYTPGLPDAPGNRALAASLASARRELKSWGVVFTEGNRKRLVTAQEARDLKAAGKRPEPGAVLTPLAKEILN